MAALERVLAFVDRRIAACIREISRLDVELKESGDRRGAWHGRKVIERREWDLRVGELGLVRDELVIQCAAEPEGKSGGGDS